jgi:UDP:flavonoid glycosyltransferase YjiC (YdhE family)
MTDRSASLTNSKRRPRILFFGEATTLAHVARPVVLARSLDPALYDVRVACHPRYNHLLGDLPFSMIPIHSIAPELFLDRIRRGSPLWNVADYRTYVKEDLAVIKNFSPDMIVGDWRLSLSISARLAKVPYIAINNAYYSPFLRPYFPPPDLAVIRLIGLRIFGAGFALLRPLAMAYHSLPLNRARHAYGLPFLSFDLIGPYTDADYVLYVDVPELVPIRNLPHHHRYLGPILWSPVVKCPEWWGEVPADRPVIYVSLGSSGQARLLPVILDALATLPVTVLATTAGMSRLSQVPPNAFVADYLPGEEAARRACLVICNGGSPTTQQALAAGKPILGLTGNTDQLMNMGFICSAGAGMLLRATQANEKGIRTSVLMMLQDQRYATAAEAVQSVFARYDIARRFRELVDEVATGRR